MHMLEMINVYYYSVLNIIVDVYPYRYPWVVKAFDYSKYNKEAY